MTTTTGLEFINVCRSILVDGSRGKVDGVYIDSFTAGAVVEVYDAIPYDSKKKLVSLPWQSIITAAWKILK